MVVCVPMRYGPGGTPPSSGSKTIMCPVGSLPSRLQRPAACTMRSSGPMARKTSGKSTSTPASMTCVEIRRHVSPDFSRWRTSSSVARLCAPHILVERWNTAGSPGRSRALSSFIASVRVFTIVNTWCRLRILSATSCQLHFSCLHGN